MASSKEITLKLLIDAESEKVLFAEAGKDFVDFLFYLIALPVGTVIDLQKKEVMVGCLSNLYESIENLSDTYMLTTKSKDSLLKPTSSVAPSQSAFMLPGINSMTPKFYCANGINSCICLTDVKGILCRCRKGGQLSVEAEFVAGNAESASFVGGFVKEVTTYMVMNDLAVQPMSSIFSVTLLNKLNVREVGCVEEKVVNFGTTEALKLLKASFPSKTVLTDVFLNNELPKELFESV